MDWYGADATKMQRRKEKKKKRRCRKMDEGGLVSDLLRTSYCTGCIVKYVCVDAVLALIRPNAAWVLFAKYYLLSM